MLDSSHHEITVSDIITVQSIYTLYMVDTCSQVVTLSLLVFETFSTLQDEVELLWPARWSGMKLLFVVNKYSPFIDTVFSVTLATVLKDPTSCTRQYRLMTSFYFVSGGICPGLILMMRTIALWGFNKSIIVLTLTGAVGLISGALFTVIRYLMNFECPSIDVTHIIGCTPCIQDLNVWPAYMCLMLADTGIIGLTLVKRYLDPVIKAGARTNLSLTIYRDGSLFFIIILVISAINLLVMTLIPRELGNFMQMPLRVLHSALATRVLLNLRKAAARSSATTLTEFTMRTTVAFAPGVDLEPVCDGLRSRPEI